MLRSDANQTVPVVQPFVAMCPAAMADGGLNGALFGLLIGTLCGVGGLLTLAGVLLSPSRDLGGSLCSLLSMAFGATYFPPHCPRALAYFRFGRSRATISPELVRPGASFTFRHEQFVRLPIRASVTLSLVAREAIVTWTSDGNRTEHRDHLIQSFEQPSLEAGAREWVTTQQAFTAPARSAMELVEDRQVIWLVKVRLLPRQGLDLQEFELPYFAVRETFDGENTLREAAERYSVVLLKNKWPVTGRFMRAIQVVAPHLTSSQVRMLAMSTPVVLVQNLSREHAEQARVRLEGVGAVVEVCQGGVVIPPPPGQCYPIPYADAVTHNESLPRPSDPDAPDAR